MIRKYTLTPEQRSQFQQLCLLNRISLDVGGFPLILSSELEVLEPLLTTLTGNGLLKLSYAGYILSDVGQDCLKKFRERYSDYLTMYDVYSAVDLSTGEFAYSSILEMSPEQLKIFLNQERWEDLRVAVAVYKKLDALEIVFMSFLNEGRFNSSGTGWALNLVGELLWDEILNICGSALHPEDLGTEDVIQDVINMGSQVMVNVLRGAQKISSQQNLQQASSSTMAVTFSAVTVMEEEAQSYRTINGGGGGSGGGYYGCYGSVWDMEYLYDPYYVAPCWATPYWYW